MLASQMAQNPVTVLISQLLTPYLLSCLLTNSVTILIMVRHLWALTLARLSPPGWPEICSFLPVLTVPLAGPQL